MDNSTSGSLQLSKHRIEALVDGIFAVAMTLLVIELRLPEHLNSDAQLHEALIELLPNFGSWLVSFVVLGVFWMANHRIYSHVRQVDTSLVWWTLLMLAGASLLPFASAVNGRVASQLAQAVYSAVMILTIAGSLMVCRHVHRNPQLCAHPMDSGTYRCSRARPISPSCSPSRSVRWAGPCSAGRAASPLSTASVQRFLGTAIQRLASIQRFTWLSRMGSGSVPSPSTTAWNLA